MHSIVTCNFSLKGLLREHSTEQATSPRRMSRHAAWVACGSSSKRRTPAASPSGSPSGFPPPARSAAHRASLSAVVKETSARFLLASIKFPQTLSKNSPLGLVSFRKTSPQARTSSPSFSDRSTVSSMARAGRPMQSSAGTSWTHSLVKRPSSTPSRPRRIMSWARDRQASSTLSCEMPSFFAASCEARSQDGPNRPSTTGGRQESRWQSPSSASRCPFASSLNCSQAFTNRLGSPMMKALVRTSEAQST
mmetsp:Transcript_106179/g.317193  ORF Transcript_106179/g.317193 Transcript_106179/m.317193 type:complete len:250 (-) Transcript_106179:980-1729(-)